MWLTLTIMPTTVPYRLHASLGYQLSLAARLQERRLENSLKSLGLTRITWCILLAIGNENLHQPSDIAGFVGIDRTATSRALRRMETNGLIERGSGPRDGRTRAAGLTDHGRKLLARGTPLAQENNDVLVASLSAVERRTLADLLKRTHAGIDTLLARL